MRIVRAYTQEEVQEREFDALNREYLAKNMALARTSGVFHPILGLLTGLGTVVVLWIGGGEAIRGEISSGDFVAFSFYLAMLTWPMIALGLGDQPLRAGRGGARPDRCDHAHRAGRACARRAVRLEAVRGEIEFRNVSFRYPGTERDVLRNVSVPHPCGARPPRSSGRPARASPPSSRCSRGSTTRPPARCCSTACRSRASTPRRSVRRWASCPRNRSSSRKQSRTTSRSDCRRCGAGRPPGRGRRGLAPG